MKQCSSCGRQAISDNATFCKFCGGNLVKIVEHHCKRCGVQVEPDMEFCESCLEETKFDTGSFDPRMVNTYSDDSYMRSITPAKRRTNFLFIAVAVFSVIACVLAITTLYILSTSDKFKGDEKTVASSEVEETVIENTDEKEDAAENIEVSQPEEKQVTKQSEAPKEVPARVEPSYETGGNVTRVLYDYDPNNNDWYRLRRSRNDASTQAGAYKTVEKALYYAGIYCPQGYTLYDKDFNVVDTSNYTVGTNYSTAREDDYATSYTPTTPATTAPSSSGGLYDYDPNNSDWYRIRKSRNDASTQVGAYKTVEKAFYYADIYCPQGYTLYDKDFNVIR